MKVDLDLSVEKVEVSYGHGYCVDLAIWGVEVDNVIDSATPQTLLENIDNEKIIEYLEENGYSVKEL